MPPSARAALRYIAEIALLAALYAGAAWLGLRYVTIGHSISLVWPPAGLAFAALVLRGRRLWPGVTIGALLANALTPIPLAGAAGLALGNTAAALLATAIDHAADGRRAVPELAQQRPQEHRDADQDREDHDGTEHRRLDLVPLPRKQHLAGPIGEPRQSRREKADADEIQDEADHCLASFAAGAAPSDDLS